MTISVAPLSFATCCMGRLVYCMEALAKINQLELSRRQRALPYTYCYSQGFENPGPDQPCLPH